jgi:ABC-type sugar transport system ATPase subunit
MDEILRLSHISKTFPDVRALNDISFDLKQAKIHCLCGQNGAGKSAVIKIGGFAPKRREIGLPKLKQVGKCLHLGW